MRERKIKQKSVEIFAPTWRTDVYAWKLQKSEKSALPTACIHYVLMFLAGFYLPPVIENGTLYRAEIYVQEMEMK